MKILILLLLALVCRAALAQIPAGELRKIDEARVEHTRREAKVRAAIENSFRELARLAETPKPQHPTLRGAKEIQAELNVSDEDYSKYRAILAGEDQAGIFKLLPEPDCRSFKNEALRKCLERRVKIFGSGGFSFREKRRTTQNTADLILFGDILRARGKGIQTILVDLGDVSLADVSINSDSVKYLVDLVPDDAVSSAAKRFDDLTTGVTHGNYLYGSWVRAQVDRSYALRSIAYEIRGLKNASGRSGDVIVAFRIIRRDENGALTIVWKELRRQEAPVIRSNE